MSVQMLPRTVAVAQQGIAEHLHLGVQVYVSRHGRPVADLAVGEARTGVPMTADTLVPWFCAGKPITVAAVAQLWEQGRLELDDRVTRYVPEFATGGENKEQVTVRHLLTHTGSFPWANRPEERGWWDYINSDWDDALRTICAAPLEQGWVPGKRAGYHPTSSWFVLGEIVRRVDGRPIARYLQEEIFAPLGMCDTRVAIPSEEAEALGGRLCALYDSRSARPVPIEAKRSVNWLALGDPGSGLHGPVHDLGRFYEMLLFRGQRDGVPILSPQSVEALTAHQRVVLYDAIVREPVSWGLGMEVDRSLFPPASSERAFGHSGWRATLAFVDPAYSVVAAFVANGMPEPHDGKRRMEALAAAIYQDLGNASPGGAPAETAVGR